MGSGPKNLKQASESSGSFVMPRLAGAESFNNYIVKEEEPMIEEEELNKEADADLDKNEYPQLKNKVVPKIIIESDKDALSEIKMVPDKDEESDIIVVLDKEEESKINDESDNDIK